MTETTDHLEQADGAELSGVDLVRAVLHAARDAAKRRGDEARMPRRRQQRIVRRDGREPSGFAAVLQGLMAERAWELPAAGGTASPPCCARTAENPSPTATRGGPASGSLPTASAAPCAELPRPALILQSLCSGRSPTSSSAPHTVLPENTRR